MARVKRAVNAHKKRRVVLERASGYRGQRSRLYRKAKEQLLHTFMRHRMGETDDHELVAADAVDIIVAEIGARRVRKLAQHHVAGLAY